MNRNFKNIANLGKYFRLSDAPPLFIKGKNEILYDTNNKKFIDLACGSGTSVLGYKNPNAIKNLKKAGVEDYLLDSKLMSVDQLVVLNEKNIKTRDQLADLSNDELIEILSEIDKVKADEIIMDARKHWF